MRNAIRKDNTGKMKTTDAKTLVKKLIRHITDSSGSKREAVETLKNIGFTENDISVFIDDRELLLEVFIENMKPGDIDIEEKFRELYEDGIVKKEDLSGSVKETVGKYKNMMFAYIRDTLLVCTLSKRKVIGNAEELFGSGKAENCVCFGQALFACDDIFVKSLEFAKQTEKLYEDSLRLLSAMKEGNFTLNYDYDDLSLAM